jgi:hypothetical protein
VFDGKWRVRLRPVAKRGSIKACIEGATVRLSEPREQNYMLPTAQAAIWFQQTPGSGLLWEFANWLENTQIGSGIAGSTWAYPYVQLTHFTGLSLWMGTTFAVDLHLLGVVKREQTTAQLQKALIVWNWIGFAILITGGGLLFSTAATTFIANPAIEVKLGLLLPVALIWHILVQMKIRTWGQTMDPPKVAKVVGLVEILLWLSVATAATTIPYF